MLDEYTEGLVEEIISNAIEFDGITGVEALFEYKKDGSIFIVIDCFCSNTDDSFTFSIKIHKNSIRRQSGELNNDYIAREVRCEIYKMIHENKLKFFQNYHYGF